MEPGIYINPSGNYVLDAVTLSGNMLKSICDASGNLYLWDGDTFEHRQIMDRYNIPDELYCTANCFYKDQGGEQQLAEYVEQWREHIKGKTYVDAEWLRLSS